MNRTKAVLPIVGALLLSVSGILVWKKAGNADRAVDLKPQALPVNTRGRPAAPSTDKVDPVVPPNRTRSNAERQDFAQINDWIADQSLSPEMAAGNLWKLASDPARAESVRDEALTHALNLTDDETFQSVVIPLIKRKDLWSEPLGEKILNDLYNRPGPLKILGAAALFEHSSGELHDNSRRLLAFELGDPGLENLGDAELIRRLNERLKAASEAATSNAPPEP